MCASPALAPPAATATTATSRVAGIVVTHNGREHIRSCLRSLLAQPEELRAVVVVDNASADDTTALVREEFSGVRVLAQPGNLGYGDAANRGAGVADAEYVAVINQDVVSTPGWIGRLVAALDADPRAAIATPMILIKSDPTRVNTCGNAPHYTGITTCPGYNRRAWEFTQAEAVPAVSGAAMVIRREAFEALGGFDPLFFLYLEDTDLSLRAVMAGYHCLVVPRAAVLHEFEPRFSPEKIGFLERNRYAMLLKLFRWRTLAVLTPALLLTEVAVLGYSLLRGPRCLRSKLGAYTWVASRLPTILDARRRAQALRRLSDRALLGQLSDEIDVDELGHSAARVLMRLVNPLFRAYFRIARAVVRW
jgi:GT2 family glycosyltransferase